MKKIILTATALFSAVLTFAQMAVTAPTLELQQAMNHAEQMQQAVQTYQTMVNVKSGVEKGVDAIEKVNARLKTVREVQDIASRSAACIRRIQKVYNLISGMNVNPTYTMDLLSQCNQATKECVAVTAYGAGVFSSGFLKMNDAERLAETRKVLDDIDRLLARANYINYQAKAIEFNTQMLNSYFK